MFISSSRPLANRRVRLEDGREFELDDTGQFEVELQTGPRRIEVRIDDSWVTTHVDIKEDGETLVVDVDETDTDNRTGLEGQTLGGRYHIEAALGQGGMGTVYRATDVRLERPVAIKTLNERLRADDEARRLFIKEARQMAALSHPHLAAVHDVTTLDGHQLMVTELVDGASLEHWLSQHGPLSVDDALVVAYQMAIAVAYLHDEGVIHRDIKPANAMLEDGGGIKLIDFGLARSLEELMAKGTQVRGTPAYMAPEQVDGTGPGSATDVYQLTVTFYELLTGQLPADPDGGNMLAYIAADNEPITNHRTDLPRPLVDLIHAGFDPAPDKRPDTRTLCDELAGLYYERNGRRPPSNIDPGDWSPPNSEQSGPAVDGPQKLEPITGPADDDSGETGTEEIDAPSASNADGNDNPHVNDTDDRRDRPAPSTGRAPFTQSDMPGREPDFTGASAGGDVEWDRPVGRIALIVFIIAVLFVLGVVLHSLFFAAPQPDPQQTEPSSQQSAPQPDQRDRRPTQESGPDVETLKTAERSSAVADRIVETTRQATEAVQDSPTGATSATEGARPADEPQPAPAADSEPPADEPGGTDGEQPDAPALPDDDDDDDDAPRSDAPSRHQDDEPDRVEHDESDQHDESPREDGDEPREQPETDAQNDDEAPSESRQESEAPEEPTRPRAQPQQESEPSEKDHDSQEESQEDDQPTPPRGF